MSLEVEKNVDTLSLLQEILQHVRVADPTSASEGNPIGLQVKAAKRVQELELKNKELESQLQDLTLKLEALTAKQDATEFATRVFLDDMSEDDVLIVGNWVALTTAGKLFQVKGPVLLPQIFADHMRTEASDIFASAIDRSITRPFYTSFIKQQNLRLRSEQQVLPELPASSSTYTVPTQTILPPEDFMD